ncbi:MAG TPA: hypothetical protein VN828_21085 [Acidobacteriaceae bacterium]|nr:hypothetical protein [Acidobacteriaceae bacterium]
MKSDIRTFVHSAVAAASNRPAATTEPNRNLMLRFKAAYLLVLMGLVAPMQSFAAAPGPAPYCIAVGGGFGNGGSTFVARNFSMPEANKCTPWTGYTKTSATVIFTTNGTACLSGDSTALTVSVSSQDPAFLGTGTLAADYIYMARTSATEPFSGSDQGYLMGTAEPTSCTNDLLTLPAYHD